MIDINTPIDIKDIGLDLAVIGSALSIVGVLLFNLFQMYSWATLIWCFSNIILMVYFYGHMKDWWDGKLSSEVICAMYFVFTVAGIIGVIFGVK